MLKLAKIYEQELNNLFIERSFTDKFKYYTPSNYFEYEVKLHNDSWAALEFVSIDEEDNVLGFMSAKIDRIAESVASLRVINFYELNYTFSKDFHQFLEDIFMKHNFRKMCFGVVIGNPAEKMYDKYIEKYKGRIVGTYKEDVKLFDGNYYDVKYYEIFKQDYESAKKGSSNTYDS